MILLDIKSSITIGELRFRISAMPFGKRQTALRDRLKGDVLPHFFNSFFAVMWRVLSFTSYHAIKYRGKRLAQLMAALQPQRQQTAYDLARDTSPFEAARLKLINPGPNNESVRIGLMSSIPSKS